jgi:hypothetical protein
VGLVLFDPHLSNNNPLLEHKSRIKDFLKCCESTGGRRQAFQTLSDPSRPRLYANDADEGIFATLDECTFVDPCFFVCPHDFLSDTRLFEPFRGGFLTRPGSDHSRIAAAAAEKDRIDAGKIAAAEEEGQR